MSKPAIVPVAQNETNQCTVTPQWFVDGSEYEPLLGSFRLLINGEEAFREVYRAIQAAQKSVSIICWGFQPSMYFIRDGASLPIGKLLEKKAEEGVQVRVLCWSLDVSHRKLPPWIDPLGLFQAHYNVTGVKPGLGESNTPGRWDQRLMDRPPTATDAQHDFDVAWYDRYDENQEFLDTQIKKIRAYKDPKAKNLHFSGRGFSAVDRGAIARTDFADKGLGTGSKAMLVDFPSHHQKTVLVDVEDPHACTGFVMGHNMLDEYWDTDAHSAQRSMLLYGRPERQPDRYANGARPRHDFSARITGPIVGDVFANFAVAWEKQTGEALEKPDFTYHPINPLASNQKKQQASEQQKPGNVLRDIKPPPFATRDPVIMGQILRTQPQYGKEDIKACYLQAINNATQYIHIENQYFRWPPLAEKIKACAAGQTCGGRQPETHGPLYLFVITNSTDDGVGAGTVNTYRMLESLGRADTIPAVARQERADDVKAKLKRAEQEVAEERLMQRGLETSLTRARNSDDRLRTKRLIEASQARQKDAEARLPALREKKRELEANDYIVEAEDVPGLKCLIGTLVAPDTKDGQPWVEVYIHAKLMLINDAFMTLGSANINTRSMEVDSELNIAHHRPEITQPVRQKLWSMHTGGKSGAETMDAEGMDKAYTVWKELMEENAGLRAKKLTPAAPLAAFLRTDPTRSNLD